MVEVCTWRTDCSMRGVSEVNAKPDVLEASVTMIDKLF